MSFVNAHFISYATDLGYSRLLAAGAFSIIGASAIAGSLVLGHLSDRYGRRRFLALAYATRGLGFVIVLLSMGIPFLGIPALGLSTLLIGIILVGLSWNSAVSLTAAYASDRYGVSHLGKIYGTIFMVMPIGSGLGASLGGLLFDVRGSYDVALWSNLVLGLAAALVVFLARERQPAPPEAVPVTQLR